MIRLAPRRVPGTPHPLVFALLAARAVTDVSASDCIEIQCPADIIQACASRGGQVVNFNVTASNRCGRVPPTVVCVPPSGSVFVVGETVVACAAYGDDGTNHCSFTVTIRDEDPPALTCPEPIIADAQGLDGAVVNFTVSAVDACSSNVTVLAYPPSGSVFPVGVTRVLCLARDSAGNESSCILPVTVRSPRRMELAPHPRETTRLRLRWYVQGNPEQTDSLDTPDWRRVTEPIVRDGDERFMDVPRSARLQFYRLAVDPLGPPPDEDGDGVPDASDVCPETPEGRPVDVCGCSPVQVVRDPLALIEKPKRLLEELRMELEREPAYDSARETLTALLSLMDADTDFLKRGEIAGGADRYSGTMTSLIALESDLARLRPRVVRPPLAGDEADVDDSDDRNMFLDYLARRLERANDAARVAESCFHRAKDQVLETTTVTGRISTLRESGRGAVLESGEQLEFASGLREFDLVEGAEATLSVVRFKDGITLVTDIQAMNADETLTLTKVSLVNLRIAPWQYFGPQGPWLLHHPSAYRHDGSLYLERGMRLAAAGHPIPSPSTLFHALRLELKYYSVTAGSIQTVTLAAALRHGDKPIELPSDMATNSSSVLTATKLHFPQIVPGQRSAAVEVLGVESHQIELRPRYFYATTGYSQRVFDLEDSPTETAHGAAEVTGFGYEFPVSEYPAPVFTAQGYKVLGEATSYPSVETVGVGTAFAIFAHDFFNPDLPAISEHFNGTPSPSGLRWPRVTGQNNGYTYSYACAVPRLVRDRIASCGNVLNDCFNDADTFYRLPFVQGYPIWTMGQGNCGQATHFGNSQYAYDMRAPSGTGIRAARGGVVVFVEESESGNCCPFGSIDTCLDPCPFLANSVAIEHQDGTVGVYVHMPKDGVHVAVGDRVRRGDPIAIVGSTGISTGPHLHFVVKKALGDKSLPSRFQTVNDNCFRPVTGDLLLSNNKAWYE